MQEQADTTTQVTTRIVKHKSTGCKVWVPQEWVVNVRGSTYGITETRNYSGSQTSLIFASHSVVEIPFGVYTILAICVCLLCAAVIIPTAAASRKP